MNPVHGVISSQDKCPRFEVKFFFVLVRRDLVFFWQEYCYTERGFKQGTISMLFCSVFSPKTGAKVQVVSRRCVEMWA